VLLPVVALVSGVQTVPRSGEAAARSDAEEPPKAVVAAAESVAAVQLPEAAAVLDVAAVPRQAAGAAGESGAAVEPQQAAVGAGSDAEGPRRAEEGVSVAPVALQRAAGPSAALWVFRRDRALPLPARRRAARSAHAMRRS
jgi:hypothetical protein